MCWIGSLLFFLAANLLFFDSEELMRNIYELRGGHWGSTSFIFFALLLVFFAMFASGLYYQYDTYKKKRDLLKFSYLSADADQYKAIENPEQNL